MNEHAAVKRHEQGWLTDISSDIDESIDLMVNAAAGFADFCRLYWQYSRVVGADC